MEYTQDILASHFGVPSRQELVDIRCIADRTKFVAFFACCWSDVIPDVINQINLNYWTLFVVRKN